MPNGADELLFLYELCVQRPEALVNLIRAAHAQCSAAASASARTLHEDFCGSGAVSRQWVSSDPLAEAVATDIDPEIIEFGRRRAAEDGLPAHRLTWQLRDLREPARASPPSADAVFVGNFSIGELHSRAQLLAYLRSARSRLRAGGVFICDTYGGAAAFRTGLVHRAHPGRSPNERFLYTWEQRSIDPYTARVTNALHFRVERDGEIVSEHFDAFIYSWRLWSVPELREAMLESGFATTRVVDRLDAAAGNAAPDDPDATAEHHIACIIGSA